MKAFVNYLLRKKWILRIVMYFLSEGKKERIYIATFRAEMTANGCDSSELTDDEIKIAMSTIHELEESCKFTPYEITRAMETIFHCVR